MVREFILFRALDDVVQDQRTTKGFAGRYSRFRRQSTGELDYTHVSTSLMSWYWDVSSCRTFLTFSEKHWPGQRSLTSLNQPSVFMVVSILDAPVVELEMGGLRERRLIRDRLNNIIGGEMWPMRIDIERIGVPRRQGTTYQMVFNRRILDLMSSGMTNWYECEMRNHFVGNFINRVNKL